MSKKIAPQTKFWEIFAEPNPCWRCPRCLQQQKFLHLHGVGWDDGMQEHAMDLLFLAVLSRVGMRIQPSPRVE